MLLRKMQAMKTATEENKQKKNILHQKMDWTLNKHLEQIYFCPFLAIGGESSVKQLLWMTIMHDFDAFLSSHHNKVMPHGNARQCVNTKGGHWIKLDKKKKKIYKMKTNCYLPSTSYLSRHKIQSKQRYNAAPVFARNTHPVLRQCTSFTSTFLFRLVSCNRQVSICFYFIILFYFCSILSSDHLLVLTHCLALLCGIIWLW